MKEGTLWSEEQQQMTADFSREIIISQTTMEEHLKVLKGRKNCQPRILNPEKSSLKYKNIKGIKTFLDH